MKYSRKAYSKGSAGMGVLSIRTAILISLMSLGAAGPAQAQTPQRPAIGGLGSPPDAMIFYVARGAAGACGPNCSEWIAAEGTVQQLDTAAADIQAALGLSTNGGPPLDPSNHDD